VTSGPIALLRRYRFADLTLDTGQRRLWRGREEIQVSKLSFDFLRTLVEAAPNLLTHDQLAEAVWGPRRVITPENLSQRVKMLRQALGEEAEQPRYIEAVRAQGYRLIPAVETAPIEALPHDGRPIRSAEEPGSERRSKTMWLIGEHKQTVLLEGENVIGRAEDTRIRIDLPGVSRHHARVTVTGGAAVLEDLGSKNGTFLNRQTIAAPQRLADGDEILVVGVLLKFRVASATSPTATVAVGNQPIASP
jgi:DNA-binding winged helix-turn-helix (wHTH) protein